MIAISKFCLCRPDRSQRNHKPKLTLDEFFNSVDFTALEISPDGNSVVIAHRARRLGPTNLPHRSLALSRRQGMMTERTTTPKTADATGKLIQLTQSGHDSDPKWSPDGRWIAFLSERKSSSEKSDDADSDC